VCLSAQDQEGRAVDHQGVAAILLHQFGDGRGGERRRAEKTWSGFNAGLGPRMRWMERKSWRAVSFIPSPAFPA
jgi:hypothetical protein